MKSLTKNLLTIARAILEDSTFTNSQQLERDWVTIQSRVKHEGVSFLTLTLPAFGQDIINSLATGEIASTAFRSFKKAGRIPAFLQGIVRQVFDGQTGKILDQPDINSIKDLRQLTSVFKKVKISCTEERNINAVERFIQDDEDLQHPLPAADMCKFKKFADLLWNPIISGIDRGDWFSPNNWLPSHGPGATADSKQGNVKFVDIAWHERLEPFFPILGTAYSLSAQDDGFNSENQNDFRTVPWYNEQPVKVTLVPKTLKTPRIIAIEPVCMQMCQHALANALIESLSRCEPTRNRILFDNQEKHKELALQSSKSQDWSTIDLSAASDRVPLNLALMMFDSNPDFRDATRACRSFRAKIRGRERIVLNKFASMGSAMCFPVQAMYFYTICIMALAEYYGTPVTSKVLKRLGKKIYVYGDDIIVPTHSYDIVVYYLEKYYCKVGRDKSFHTGHFRESCGMDAYDGTPITPVYIRSIDLTDDKRSSTVIGLVATSNQFYKAGYWRTAERIRHIVERTISGKLPLVGPSCAGLGWVSYQRRVSYDRWCKRLQAPLVKTLVPMPVYRNDPIDGHAALAKCLLRLEGPPGPSDVRHLERTARHMCVAMRTKWVRPY